MVINAKIKSFNPKILYIFFLCTIFLPWINISDSAPLLRPEWILVFILVYLFGHAYRVDNFIFIWTALLFFFMGFSMLFGILYLDSPFSFPDIFELLKPLLYLLIYIIASNITLSLGDISKLQKNIILLFSIAAIIAIVQYIEPDLIKPILKLYTDSDRIDLYRESRATGTMGNANDLGMLFVIGTSLCLFTLRQKLFPKNFSLFFLLLQIFGVFASGSRTALVIIIVVILYFFFIETFKFKSGIYLVYLLFFISIFGIIIFSNSDIFFLSFDRYSALMNVREDTAFLSRVEAMMQTIELIKKSVFFGWGPNKVGFPWRDNVDNEYILFLYRYGVIGLATVIILIYKMWRIGQVSSKFKNLATVSYGNFLTAIMLGSVVFAYTAGIFQQFRLMTLILIFLGIGKSIARSA